MANYNAPTANTAVTTTSIADDRVNHQEVQRIIEQTLNFEVSGSKTTERVAAAFYLLRERRRTVAPNDVNLAAAEHYMFARALAGTTGDPLVLAAPALYALKKTFYFAIGQEKSMRTSPNNPVLPPSVESVVWGTLGVEQGLKDYRGENPSVGLKAGAAIPSLASDAYAKAK